MWEDRYEDYRAVDGRLYRRNCGFRDPRMALRSARFEGRVQGLGRALGEWPQGFAVAAFVALWAYGLVASGSEDSRQTHGDSARAATVKNSIKEDQRQPLPSALFSKAKRSPTTPIPPNSPVNNSAVAEPGTRSRAGSSSLRSSKGGTSPWCCPGKSPRRWRACGTPLWCLPGATATLKSSSG